MGYINNEERTLAIPNNKDWYGTEGYGDYGIIFVDTIPIGVVFRDHPSDNTRWTVFRWYLFSGRIFPYSIKCVEGNSHIHLARRDGIKFGLKVYSAVKCNHTLGVVLSEVYHSRVKCEWKSSRANPIDISWPLSWTYKDQDENGKIVLNRVIEDKTLGHSSDRFYSKEINADNRISYEEFIGLSKYGPFTRFWEPYYEDIVAFEVVEIPDNNSLVAIMDKLHNVAFELYWSSYIRKNKEEYFKEISLDEYEDFKKDYRYNKVSQVDYKGLLEIMNIKYQNYLKKVVKDIAKKAIDWDYETPYKEHHVYIDNGEYTTGPIDYIRVHVGGEEILVLITESLPLSGERYKKEYLTLVKELKTLVDVAVENRKQQYQEYLEKKEKESNEPDKLTGRRARRIRLSKEDLEETED